MDTKKMKLHRNVFGTCAGFDTLTVGGAAYIIATAPDKDYLIIGATLGIAAVGLAGYTLYEAIKTTKNIKKIEEENKAKKETKKTSDEKSEVELEK